MGALATRRCPNLMGPSSFLFLLQLEGSVKSAQVLFARYDMDLDQRLKQQDYYDLMLELALALPYQEYQKFIEASFAYAGACSDDCSNLKLLCLPVTWCRAVWWSPCSALSTAHRQASGFFLFHLPAWPYWCIAECLGSAEHGSLVVLG